ncbi:MAG: hypothetical protein VX563_01095, partial [Planctomycetota bacterium]|nr:hypothetical protein [Planctomycetota bacterium]
MERGFVLTMLPVDDVPQQREARAADTHVVLDQVEGDQHVVGLHRRGIAGLMLGRDRAALHLREVAEGGLLGDRRAGQGERFLARHRHAHHRRRHARQAGQLRRSIRLLQRALELAVEDVEEHADDAAGAVGGAEGEVQRAQHRVGEVAERALGA